MELLASRGLNSFMNYALPEMTLTLRQGLGRLLRSSRDRGVIAIFDKRLLTQRYSGAILKSLPPSALVTDISRVAEFFANL